MPGCAISFVALEIDKTFRSCLSKETKTKILFLSHSWQKGQIRNECVNRFNGNRIRFLLIIGVFPGIVIAALT